MNQLLTDLLVCPNCLSDVTWDVEEIDCTNCRSHFVCIDGIPVMLPSHGRNDLDADLKDRQAAFFGEESDSDFEINRPHGTASLYQWLLAEKFRRSFTGLEELPAEGVALTVCGGSGMDAEFLCNRGFTVISTDLSLGAARNAKQRALRRNLDLMPVVADVEHLPLRNRSIELVYVHDGLHHLTNPYIGLEEMVRVSSRAVSLTEPVAAAITALAVKLGIADEIEDAGNRVARLRMNQILETLQRNDFRATNLERYAMYYKHTPGMVFEKLSRPIILPFATRTWRFVNMLLGPMGNKMTLAAIREAQTVR